MSSALAATLARASDAAAAMGAPEVALEHLLEALCDDADAVAVLDASRVDIGRLKSEASAFLANIIRSSRPAPGGLTVSQDLRRILEAAAAAARGGKRRDINGAIVLAAIVGDGRSVAAQMLQAQGLTFDEAIRALQLALSQPGQQDALSGPGAAEDVLARARERVQSRATPSLRDIMNDRPQPAPPPPMPAPIPAPAATVPNSAVEQKIETKPSLDALKPTTPAASTPDGPFTRRREGREAPALSAGENRAEPAPMAQPTIQSPPAPQAPKQAGYAYPAAGPNAPIEDILAGLKRITPDNNRVPPPVPPPIPAPLPVGAGRAPLPPMQQPRPAGPMLQPQPHFGAPGPRLGAPMAHGMATPGAPPAANPVAPGTRPQAKPPVKREATGKVETGQLAENIPRAMRVGKTERIEIRVAKAAAKTIINGLEGGGVVWRHEITVTQAMSVRLRAPEGGFFIETASPETQWVESQLGFASDDFASWRFLVTPQSRGWARLQIIVSARTVGADGMTAETALPDQVVEVKVRTNLKRTLVRWAGWIAAAAGGGALARFGEAGLEAAQAYAMKFLN